jgi:UDP-GlcNAc:undecaprenyl-phosphate GlcNAc-1-phosphate transferase
LRDYFGSEALRRMKTEGTAIRKLFPLFEVALPLLLLVKCLVPSRLRRMFPRPPRSSSRRSSRPGSSGRSGWGRPEDHRVPDGPGRGLRGVEPSVLVGERCRDPARQRGVHRLALLDIAVSKLSKRKEGFKSTPLDFLIFLLALIIPNLPDQNLEQYDLGVVGAKIVILYFSYEVLLAEDRLRYDRVMAGTLAALAVLVLKGVFG